MIILFLLHHSPITIIEKVKDIMNVINSKILNGLFLLIILDKPNENAKIILIDKVNGNKNTKSSKISLN